VTLDPPDPVEAGQLELFTGGSRLEEDFKEVVLMVGLDAAVGAMLKKPAAQPDAETTARAEALFKEWKAKPERKLMNVDRALLLDALEDPASPRSFVAWLRGTELGDFFYQVDPGDREQVTLGRFVPLDATEKEKRKILKELKREQKKGRLIGLALDDLGQWDTWVSSSLRTAEGKPVPGGSTFEPRKYTLDAALAGRDLRLTGRARIDLEPVAGGTRTVTLSLPSDYQIQRVTSPEGKDLFYQWTSGNLTAVFPQAPAAGQTVSLVVEYTGSPVEKDWNLTTLRDTTTWYPRTGSLDRAQYDVTFHWPKGFDLVSSGRQAGSGESADGGRWERRVMDDPSPDFSFEVGHFKIETARAGHVEIRFAFGSGSALTGRGVREDVIKTVSDALLYFEEVYGPYPLDVLTVTTARRSFSQGILGFVTLSDLLLNDAGMWNRLLGLTDRRLVIAHEIAHQWWGDQVGWTSYRDQWISEAMASYAALRYSHDRLADKISGVGITAGWQSDLQTKLPSGRTVESVGPVVLGQRLDSSLTSDAYRAIVYDKGAVVLDMLARALGEDNFPKVLKQIVKVAHGGTISTEDFVAMVEKVTSTDLQGFAGQYIYGTGLSEVVYDYQLEKKPGGKGWVIQGKARQQTPHRFRYRVVTTSQGTFDVAHEAVQAVDVQRSALVVPVEIETYDPQKPKGKGTNGANGSIRGNILVKGEETAFSFEVETEPKRLWLDPKARVFGLFFDAKRSPKRVLYFKGLEAAAFGKGEDAAALYEQALTMEEPAPESANVLYVGDSIYTGNTVYWQDVQEMRRVLNARIELSRCRLFLDQGNDGKAAEALERARRVFGGDSTAVKLLQARLDVRSGSYEKAFRHLRNGITDEGDLENGEGYALLAVAAKATGHKEELDKALKKARDNGVDVTVLRP
jgi:hypothetical protein